MSTQIIHNDHRRSDNRHGLRVAFKHTQECIRAGKCHLNPRYQRYKRSDILSRHLQCQHVINTYSLTIFFSHLLKDSSWCETMPAHRSLQRSLLQHSSDNVSKLAMRVCASINHSARIDEGQRLGMIDSGCNTLIPKLDAEVASIVTDMNTSEAFSGSAASSPFDTVGSGLLGIQCTYADTDGNAGAFEEVTKASFAYDWNFDLYTLVSETRTHRHIQRTSKSV